MEENVLEIENDLDYFNTSIELLKELEKISYARSERLRLFHEKTRAIRAITAGMIASFLPTVVWIYTLSSLEVNYFDLQISSAFMIRIIGLLLTTASLVILPYLFIHMMWRHPIFRSFSSLFEKKAVNQLFADIEKIDEKAYHVISHPVFRKPRIPDYYLSVEYLTLLEKYIASGESQTVKEALETLKAELEDKIFFSNSDRHPTLLQREKDYLADDKRSLAVRIRKEEEVYG